MDRINCRRFREQHSYFCRQFAEILQSRMDSQNGHGHGDDESSDHHRGSRHHRRHDDAFGTNFSACCRDDNN